MTAQEMRDHAEECRTVANSYLYFETKRIFLDLADTWENMARTREIVDDDSCRKDA